MKLCLITRKGTSRCQSPKVIVGKSSSSNVTPRLMKAVQEATEEGIRWGSGEPWLVSKSATYRGAKWVVVSRIFFGTAFYVGEMIQFEDHIFLQWVEH